MVWDSARPWGHVMAPKLAAVVEPRLVVQEAIRSLRAKSCQQADCGRERSTESGTEPVSDEPRFVVLAARSAADAVSEADAIRKTWPDCRIILLYDRASTTDVQTLLDSEINGCAPLFVSPNALTGVLNLTASVRILLLPGSEPPTLEPVQADGSDGVQQEGASGGVGLVHARPTVYAESKDLGVVKDGARCSSTPRTHPQLSERELQILDGLIKGHANKMIARTCDIAESTVKVHLKSILRKTQARNRTQAAIWALEHGYAADGIGGSSTAA